MSPPPIWTEKASVNWRDILRRLKAAGKTVLVAEHRLWYAADLADRVFYLREGQLKQIYAGAEFLGFAGREAALHGPAEFERGAAAGAPRTRHRKRAA